MTEERKRKLNKALKAGALCMSGLSGSALLLRHNRRRIIRKVSKIIKGKPAGRDIERLFPRFPHVPRMASGSLAVFASFGALTYFKGRILPKYADDYPYSFKWDPRFGNLTEAGQKYERVRTLKDLIESQIAHYKTWDGRVLADFIVQLVLMKDDKKFFDVVNSLVMLAQLLVCGCLGKGKRVGYTGLSFREALVLAAGFWVCTPQMIATCFWITGSITYLWTGLLESLFVLPYALHYHDSDFSIPAPLAALMGLTAGWSVETGAGAALMVSGMELIRSLHRKKAAPWMVAGVLGACTGMALLLAAPGNRIKFQLEKEMSDTLPKNLEERLPGYVPPEYTYTPIMFKLWFLEGFLPTMIRLLPLQLPVIQYFRKRECQTREATGYILAMESAALAIPTVMMLSPEYPKRATYHSILYMLPAAIKAMDHIDIPPYTQWTGAGRRAWKLAAGALAVNIIASLIIDADLYCQICDQADILAKHRGEDHIYLDDVGLSKPYSLLAGNRSVTWDTSMGICLDREEDPYNRATAAYYGVGSIACAPYSSHRYDQNNPEDILFKLINPLKNFVRLIRDRIRGRRWPASCKNEYEFDSEESAL